MPSPESTESNPNQPPSDPSATKKDKAGRPGSLLVIFLTVFIDLLGFGIVLPLLPLYADQFGTDTSGFMIGMLMASFSIMQFIFAPLWGALSDRVGRRPVIIVGLLGSVVFIPEMVIPNWPMALIRPYVHFIPVHRNLSNLMSQLRWAKSHDAEAKKIASASASFMKYTMHKENRWCAMHETVRAVAERQRGLELVVDDVVCNVCQ